MCLIVLWDAPGCVNYHSYLASVIRCTQAVVRGPFATCQVAPDHPVVRSFDYFHHAQVQHAQRSSQQQQQHQQHQGPHPVQPGHPSYHAHPAPQHADGQPGQPGQLGASQPVNQQSEIDRENATDLFARTPIGRLEVTFFFAEEMDTLASMMYFGWPWEAMAEHFQCYCRRYPIPHRTAPFLQAMGTHGWQTGWIYGAYVHELIPYQHGAVPVRDPRMPIDPRSMTPVDPAAAGPAGAAGSPRAMPPRPGSAHQPHLGPRPIMPYPRRVGPPPPPPQQHQQYDDRDRHMPDAGDRRSMPMPAHSPLGHPAGPAHIPATVPVTESSYRAMLAAAAADRRDLPAYHGLPDYHTAMEAQSSRGGGFQENRHGMLADSRGGGMSDNNNRGGIFSDRRALPGGRPPSVPRPDARRFAEGGGDLDNISVTTRAEGSGGRGTPAPVPASAEGSSRTTTAEGGGIQGRRGHE